MTMLARGSDLVAKGVTSMHGGKLPVFGTKEMSSTGSWLEQKEIQSHLETCKQLLDVFRIEKSGSLSHAIWRDHLKLAEVTQITGGHWQYFGHNVGSRLYILPEEVLFLMECNCLLLKHNEVVVSLQKAYSLCLAEVSIAQYKVYASLCRLGYKVFRHKDSKANNNETKNDVINDTDNKSQNNKEYNNGKIQEDHVKNENIDDIIENSLQSCEIVSNNDLTCNKVLSDNIISDQNELVNCSEEITVTIDVDNSDVENDENLNCKNEDSVSKNSENNSYAIKDVKTENNSHNDSNLIVEAVTGNNSNTNNTTMDPNTNPVIYSVDELGVIRIFSRDHQIETDNIKNGDCDLTTNESNIHNAETSYYGTKIEKLLQRKSKMRSNFDGLNTIQDFYEQKMVNVNVPDEKYLPRSVFLHKAAYVLNVDLVRNQNASSVTNDENEGIESQLAQASSSDISPNVGNFQENIDSHYFYNSYRPYRSSFRYNSYWRPRNAYYAYNMYRQSLYCYPRFRYQPYVRNFMNSHNTYNIRNSIRNQRSNKMYHYNQIVNITNRFKRGAFADSQVQSLQRLVNTFNLIYNEQLDLTSNFDIIKRTNEVESGAVIVLDDDEPKTKKQRLNQDEETKTQNLKKLKNLAKKLKDLHMKNLATSRHRRVFSNALKTFNKYFNADIYLDSSFAIKDRQLIVIDSSSDSDTAVTVEDSVEEKTRKRKKLRNPYSILKRSNNVNENASTSQEVPEIQTLIVNMTNNIINTNENSVQQKSPILENNEQGIFKYFNKAWVPDDDDFGRPEVCSRKKSFFDLFMIYDLEYINKVFKKTEFENWVDLKLSIIEDVQKFVETHKQQADLNELALETNSQSIVKSDFTNLRLVLDELAIIKSNSKVVSETNLRINYDVYDRDVNIKKTNLPKPNFVVVCVVQPAPFPSCDDVAALHSRTLPDVPIVYAFIYNDSISYVHIDPINLPTFISQTFAENDTIED